MPLNGITLGQIITDPINWTITITEWASTYVGYERLIWNLVILDQFDSINQNDAIIHDPIKRQPINSDPINGNPINRDPIIHGPIKRQPLFYKTLV